jgi:hypothetical protein
MTPKQKYKQTFKPTNPSIVDAILFLIQMFDENEGCMCIEALKTVGDSFIDTGCSPIVVEDGLQFKLYVESATISKRKHRLENQMDLLPILPHGTVIIKR